MKTELLLILCGSILGQITAKELSKKVLDFLTYFTGDVDNREHIQLKGDVYDLVEVRARLVHVPALGQQVTVFVEQATNGVIKVFQLGVVTDGPGDTVTMKLYNFTDSSNLTFGIYNLNMISKVKLEQLQSDDECVASFEVVGKGLMTGIYPNCRYTDNRKHPYIIITYTCDFYTVVFPINTDQKYNIAQYVFRHLPARNFLKDAPRGYINPCGY